MNFWKKGALLILFSLLVIPVKGIADDENDLEAKIRKHIKEVYLGDLIENTEGHPLRKVQVFTDIILEARIYGYAHNQQFRFVKKKNTRDHENWGKMEDIFVKWLEIHIDEIGKRRRLPQKEKDALREDVMHNFRAASFGLLHDQMLVLTGVRPDTAPYFLDTFSENPSDRDSPTQIQELLGRWLFISVYEGASTESPGWFDLKDEPAAGRYYMYFNLSSVMYSWELVNGELLIYRKDGTLRLKLKKVRNGVWEGPRYQNNGIDVDTVPRTGEIIRERIFR